MKTYRIRGLVLNRWTTSFYRTNSIAEAVELFVSKWGDVAELSVKEVTIT